jgi:hypothetical protein
MATNPYVNKVVSNAQTLIDLTSDTVTPADVLAGVTFHDASGASQVGTAAAGKTIASVSQRIVPSGQTSVIVKGTARYTMDETMDYVWNFTKTIQSSDADITHWYWSYFSRSYGDDVRAIAVKNSSTPFYIAMSETTTVTEYADNYSWAQHLDGIYKVNGKTVVVATQDGTYEWTASDYIQSVNAAIDYANRTIQLTASLVDGTTEQSELINNIYEYSDAGIKSVAITSVEPVNPTGYQIVTDIYYTDGTSDTYTQPWPSADGGAY